jgi:hypothetical protein
MGTRKVSAKVFTIFQFSLSYFFFFVIRMKADSSKSGSGIWGVFLYDIR